MIAYPVTRDVGSPKNDGPELIEPLGRLAKFQQLVAAETARGLSRYR
jgi:hypothetical protein